MCLPDQSWLPCADSFPPALLLNGRKILSPSSMTCLVRAFHSHSFRTPAAAKSASGALHCSSTAEPRAELREPPPLSASPGPPYLLSWWVGSHRLPLSLKAKAPVLLAFHFSSSWSFTFVSKVKFSACLFFHHCSLPQSFISILS